MDAAWLDGHRFSPKSQPGHLPIQIDITPAYDSSPFPVLEAYISNAPNLEE
jgi:hypothetical protein